MMSHQKGKKADEQKTCKPKDPVPEDPTPILREKSGRDGWIIDSGLVSITGQLVNEAAPYMAMF